MGGARTTEALKLQAKGGVARNTQTMFVPEAWCVYGTDNGGHLELFSRRTGKLLRRPPIKDVRSVTVVDRDTLLAGTGRG